MRKRRQEYFFFVINLQGSPLFVLSIELVSNADQSFIIWVRWLGNRNDMG